MSNESIVESRKNYKRNKIIGIIREGRNVSRYDVKKMTLYSMTTVLSVIEELIADGLIYEEECEEARVGRKPVWLRVNPEGGYFIGVEFNAEMLYCVLQDLAGKIIYNSFVKISKQDDTNTIIEKIQSNIDMAIGYIKKYKNRIFGIGIGVPGYIDSKAGIAISYSHIPTWKNVPLKQLMENRYRVPVYLENNVHAMAFAYKWETFREDCADFVFLSIRTGIRIVPVINNCIVMSKAGFPGQLGHNSIGTSSRVCTCGRYGCLNAEASDIAIVSKVIDGIKVGRFSEILDMAGGVTDNITIEHYINSVHRGDEDAVRLMELTAKILGEALAPVVNILAPGTIVMSGAQILLGDNFLHKIKETVRENVVEENYRNLKIIPSCYGPDIGAIGAASLVSQKEFSFTNKAL